MIVVSDTSNISYLIQLDLLSLLEKLYGEVFIPEAVYQELSAMPTQISIVDQIGRINIQQVQDRTIVEDLLNDLDLGEAESIALALEMKAELLIVDEAKDRKIARELGLKITGILGVLIAAKQAKLISSVRDSLKELRILGFYLNPRLEMEVLRLVDEV